jgi:hypothetical protein
MMFGKILEIWNTITIGFCQVQELLEGVGVKLVVSYGVIGIWSLMPVT